MTYKYSSLPSSSRNRLLCRGLPHPFRLASSPLHEDALANKRTSRKCHYFGLADSLEDWEIVEADLGYKAKDFKKKTVLEFPAAQEIEGKAKIAVSKGMYHERADGHKKFKKRACQETVNSHIKDFAIMDERFRSDLDKHSICFFAVLVLVQLDINQEKSFVYI